ncbi:MAG: hypothetical protein ABW153_06770 [Sedimenticola sp.]
MESRISELPSDAADQPLNLDAIEVDFNIAMNSVTGILDMLQLVSDDNDIETLRAGSISGVADAALKMAGQAQSIFESLLDDCRVAHEIKMGKDFQNWLQTGGINHGE